MPVREYGHDNEKKKNEIREKNKVDAAAADAIRRDLFFVWFFWDSDQFNSEFFGLDFFCLLKFIE